MNEQQDNGKYACGCQWSGDAPPKCPEHGSPKKEVANQIASVTAMVEQMKRRNLEAIRQTGKR